MATITTRIAADGTKSYQVKIRKVGVNKSKTFASKTLAKRWVLETEAAIERGTFVDHSAAAATTLGEVLKRYANEISPEKAGGFRERVRLLALVRDRPTIMKKALLSLKSSDFAALRDELLADGKSPNTTKKMLDAASLALRHAGREWDIPLPLDPASSKLVARPRGVDNPRDRRLSSAEEIKLFEKIGKLRNPQMRIWVRALTILALETAARQGELTSLVWSDIDIEKKTALVRGLSGSGSKNGEIRRIPLSTKAIDAIETLRNLPPSAEKSEITPAEPLENNSSKEKVDFGDRLFPVLQETLRGTFIKCVIRAGIKDFRFHDLRHEAISRLAAIFPSPLILQKVTGHKTMAMLSRYYNPTAEELAKSLD